MVATGGDPAVFDLGTSPPNGCVVPNSPNAHRIRPLFDSGGPRISLPKIAGITIFWNYFAVYNSGFPNN